MRIWQVSVVLAAVMMFATVQSVQAQTSKPAGETAVDDAQEGGPAITAPGKTEGQKGPATTQGADGKDGGKPGGWLFGDSKVIIVMIAVMALLWWWMGRGRRKEQQRHKEMLIAMKKGDKVTSIGGIIGTVIEVKDKEVVVKVDESSNVRMKFLRSAIRNIGSPGKDDDSDKGPGKS